MLNMMNSESDGSGPSTGKIDVDIGSVTYEHVREKMADAPAPKMQALLEFNNLNYSVQAGKKKKQILNNLTGYARPGELTVVMGPTGSGKTSLLTCLARRTKKYTGDVFVNGAKPGRHYKRQVGYVMQDDVLFASLTVYQTLLYTARLRLGHLTAKEQEQKVEDVIQTMGLSRARNTMIGGEFFRGVSGGERKRVNIANEVLTNPSLIFLDEPTSGLDTSTALAIMQMLKGMAQSGLTIVSTIHQPSSQMWNIFDNLLLLVEGQCIYFGKANKALPYFESIGLHCESHWNPADFIMGIILSEEAAKSKGKSLKEQLVLCWDDALTSKPEFAPDRAHLDEIRKTCQDTTDKDAGTYSLNFFEQLYVLTHRGWFLSYGKVFDIFAWAQTFIIAILIGVLWFQTDFTTSAYIQRGSLIFFAYTYVAGFNPAFEALFAFPMDRAVVVRERASGSYRLSAYYISKFLIEIPWYFPHSILFTIIFYFMTRLIYQPGPFFATYFIIILCIFVSSSFGLMISAATLPNTRLAMTTLTVLVLIFMATGGFFVQNYPVWIEWMQYLSYIKYAYNALVAVQSQAVFYNDNNFSDSNATYINGTELASTYFIFSPFPYDPAINCAILLLFGWSFRILGFVFLSLSITRNNNLA